MGLSCMLVRPCYYKQHAPTELVKLKHPATTERFKKEGWNFR